MTIATQLNRIIGLRNRLRTKINNLGLDNDPELMLDDCVATIEGIGGTQTITDTTVYNVAKKQYAQVQDSDLVGSNIKRGVNILGVNGTLDFSSWSTVHSGRFNASSLNDNPTYLLHTTSPEAMSFPLAKVGYDNNWMHQGDLTLNDIEYLVVDCNSIDISLPSGRNNIIGIEYIRDVYGSLGNVLIFKTLYNGEYRRLYSSNATIGLELRNITSSGTTFNNVLCLKISAIPEQGTSKWNQINCHNVIYSSNINTDVKYYDQLLYHIDIKYTN